MTENAKTFTIAGTSNQYGKVKPRFANGVVAARVKVLERNEHTAIDLRELPSAMTKEDALNWVVAEGMYVLPVKPEPEVKVKAVKVPKEPKVAKPKAEKEVATPKVVAVKKVKATAADVVPTVETDRERGAEPVTVAEEVAAE